MQSIYSLWTDGSSVITGYLRVTVLMHDENLHCVSLHYVCHRLNLAISQAYKNVSQMESLMSITSGIYNYGSQSTKRNDLLKSLNRLLKEKSIKITWIFEIRWLSTGEAITTVVRKYEARSCSWRPHRHWS